MIELKDGRYVKAFFQFEFRGDDVQEQGFDSSNGPLKDGNFMGTLYSDDPSRNDWVFVFRFRYYNDDLLGDQSADDFSWHQFSGPGEESFVMQKFVESVTQMAGAAGAELVVAVVNSDSAEQQLNVLSTLPGIHITKKPLEEFQKEKQEQKDKRNLDPSLN